MNVLSDKAIEQLRRLVREENAKYRNTEPLRRRWTGGGDGQISLVKTDASATADSTVTCSIWTGDLGSETDTTYNLTGYVRGVALDSGIWCWAYPVSAIKGIVADGGATHELVPLECNA